VRHQWQGFNGELLVAFICFKEKEVGMAQVVVIGGGIGGLSAAYELRHLLPKSHKVTLISERSSFFFVPGWGPVFFGHKDMKHLLLDIKSVVEPKGIEFIHGRVEHMDPNDQSVTVNQTTIQYDYIVISTGASLAFDVAEGFGPETGYTHSICNPHHIESAKAAWEKFLEDPGPLVAGAMAGAGCFGPAYEFIMMADHELRKRGLRDKVSITYVTPEPYTGHLGVKGVKNAPEILQSLTQEKGIRVIDNASITHFSPDTVTLASGEKLPFKYAMVLPPFRGAQFLRDVPGLTPESGFMPITETMEHPQYSNIYSIGVAVQLAQFDKTQVPIGLPKSGEMAEGMAVAVAHNIARKLGAYQGPALTPTLGALCLAEFGKTGVAFMANPVIPDPETGERENSIALHGGWVPAAKWAFEKYYMAKMRFGSALPWFETVGLRMFGVKLAKPLPADHPIHNLSADSQSQVSVSTNRG
jgi:sulfide:quinone oxidoreductase